MKEITIKICNCLSILIFKLSERGDYLYANNRKIQIFSKIGSFGIGCKLNGKNWLIEYPKNLILGNNVHIGNDAYFICDGGLTIGDNTHISRRVTIYTRNHNYEGSVLPYDNNEVLKPVTIEKNVWIGMGVCILPGVLIKEGAIIGMGTVVSKDVGKCEIIGTAPMKILKSRNLKAYEERETKQQYGGSNGIPLRSIKYNKKLLQHKKIVFILSTGRSGSQSIAKTLNQHPSIVCQHESFHQLIYLSTLLEYGELDYNTVRERVFHIFNNATVNIKENQVYGESDQRLWNLIPILIEFFPDAKFIHLIRNGKKVVTSTFARGWYSDEDKSSELLWAKYRLDGAKCKAVSKETWNSWSSFERNCWYWTYINQKIESTLSNIESSNRLTIRLDDINTHLELLQEFLDIPHKTLKPLRTNKVQKVHQKSYDEKWSIGQVKSFEEICGNTYLKYF